MLSTLRVDVRVGVRLALVLAVISCAPGTPRIDGAAGAPVGPASLWPVPPSVRTPPPNAAAPASPTASAALAKDASTIGGVRSLSLPDVVDLALRNDPATRESWALARSAASTYGSARGSLLPSLDLNADVTRSGGTNLSASGITSGTTGGTTANRGTTSRTSIAPALTLTYLLFDVGGRSGSIETARERAIAADLTHNATVLNSVLQVETTLFTYLANRALRDAQQISVSEAQADLTAATERLRLGVATLQEVLQTRTALSQARFELATDEGNLLAARGNLSFAMGLPANARFEIPPIATDDSVGDVLSSVDTLINRAETTRPELAEARAQAAALAAQVRVARSAALPAVSLRASTGVTSTYATTNTSTRPFSLGLGLSIPVFSGFSAQYDIRAAREQYEAGQARVATLSQQISVQVFTAYFQLRAATERVHSATDLLASAQQSATVAAARYREGVGTIVDVLLARSALATARAESVQARWEWRMALAQLAHDAGALDVRGQPNLPLGASAAGGNR